MNALLQLVVRYTLKELQNMPILCKPHKLQADGQARHERNQHLTNRRQPIEKVSQTLPSSIFSFTDNLFNRNTAARNYLMFTLAVFAIGIQGFHPSEAFAAPNLILNPSVETANSTSTLPLNWSNSKSGVNQTTFTYKTNEGHTGTKSLFVNMTARTSGWAAWRPNEVSVKPNTKYTYSGYYKANVATEIDIEFTSTSNVKTYRALLLPGASATTWKQASISFTTPANTSKVSIYHLIYTVGTLQTDDFSLEEVLTPTLPTVAITAPTAGAVVSGTQSVMATASDSKGIAGVQFKIDNVNLGSEDTTVPYSASWNTLNLQNCSQHSISATARNTLNLTATDIKTVTVQNAAAVSITSPAANAVLSGVVPFTASANGICTLLGVQFQVDGLNLGAEDTSAPYSVSLDTTKLANGPHSISVIGRQTSRSSSVTRTIQVDNTISPPDNIIQNPSFEIASGGKPLNWSFSSYGTNTHTFSYLNTGHTGSRSVRMEITAYTNGAVIVAPDAQLVTPGHYLYTEWYQSNVDTEVDVDITFSDGTTKTYFLGTVLASPTAWRQTKLEIDVPANAVAMTVYPVLYSKGWKTLDDVSFVRYTPAPFERGMVSITFDDGYTSQYTNAFQALLKNKYLLALKATFYILSGSLTDQPMYMTAAQIADMKNSGMEIGSHSVTHPSMPTLSQADLINEMSLSKQSLEAAIGAPVRNFAYPSGEYNLNTISVGQQYYLSQRNSDYGFNSKDLLDLSRLKVQAVNNGTTPAQVKVWVDQAIRDKSWLILLYHKIEPTQPLPAGDLYTTLPADFDAELQYIKNSGIDMLTVDEALKIILKQR